MQTMMQKTFFTALAAAVLVAQAEGTEVVLNLHGCLGGEEITYTTNKFIVNADASPVLGYIHGTGTKKTSITLNYMGANELLCADAFTWSAPEIHFAVSADAAAQAAWEETLLSRKGGTITLLQAGSLSLMSAEEPISATLLGQSEAGGSITLGSHTAQYMGYFTTLSAAQQSITADNQLALVGSMSDGTLTLIGKLSKNGLVTPEPATTTLGLLALTALMTRRKRA